MNTVFKRQLGLINFETIFSSYTLTFAILARFINYFFPRVNFFAWVSSIQNLSNPAKLSKNNICFSKKSCQTAYMKSFPPPCCFVLINCYHCTCTESSVGDVVKLLVFTVTQRKNKIKTTGSKQSRIGDNIGE